jgi:hypothetical protein
MFSSGPGNGDNSADLDRSSGGWLCQAKSISIKNKKKTFLVAVKQSTANDDDGYCTRYCVHILLQNDT